VDFILLFATFAWIIPQAIFCLFVWAFLLYKKAWFTNFWLLSFTNFSLMLQRLDFLVDNAHGKATSRLFVFVGSTIIIDITLLKYLGRVYERDKSTNGRTRHFRFHVGYAKLAKKKIIDNFYSPNCVVPLQCPPHLMFCYFSIRCLKLNCWKFVRNCVPVWSFY